MDVRNYFLCELKDQDLIVVKHIPGDSNDVDIFTKNVTAAIFNCHITMYVRVNKSLDQTQASSGKAASGQF